MTAAYSASWSISLWPPALGNVFVSFPHQYISTWLFSTSADCYAILPSVKVYNLHHLEFVIVRYVHLQNKFHSANIEHNHKIARVDATPIDKLCRSCRQSQEPQLFPVDIKCISRIFRPKKTGKKRIQS